SVSLYLQTGGSATAPDAQSYRFRAQLSNYQERARYQAASRGSGGAWQSSSVPFETEITWRGGQDGMNNLIPDRGWIVVFDIPFSSLGLGSRPNNGTLWRLAAVVHDRDDSAGTPIADRWWPENGTDLQPNSWGELHFGVPQYTPPVASARSWVTVRQGLNGAYVPDAHVGGHTNCGDPFGPLYFPNWGNANYAGYEQVNVQNQWDVADWPCFSRYYVTFPLSAIPAGKVVLSATLTLHQFGNSSPIDAEPSRIQVLTVAEDWDEGTITWNNAPLAVENIGSQVVDPIVGQANWPGVPRTWNVSRAVAQALAASQPLRLVLYSADGAYHSGKYFSSSDVPDWNAAARPTLRVWWGDIFTGEVQHNYLPLVTRR
ncbi:MAG TPA: DNRLRE domain-containing protein, partial [Candidatus Binatia bacterium]|nr:DNRLRE domain-containing protein [Candidatus Binatia bacterium]